MLDEGTVLDGTYQIVREIGSGGTGIVYLAYHLRLQKYVVVKKIREDFVGSVNTRIEVDILKKLHHTYLPQVYDFLQLGTKVYTIMEYIQGYDLQHYQREGYRFTEEQLVLWLGQLCEVLEYMHMQWPPVLHSDMKPANIMITPEGNVCLIDFNISLEEDDAEGIRGLSPWFAAPEQYEKAHLKSTGQNAGRIRLDGRMDVYSLGATMYSLMTRSYPTADPKKRIPLNKFPLPYSNGLMNIVTKAMELDPKKRYQSMTAFRKSVQHIGRADSRYRTLRNQCLALDIGYGFLLLIGILITVYGGMQMHMEQFRRDYREILQASEQMEDDTVITEGSDLLNNHSYQKYLKDFKEKSELLYLIGNSYYNKENYQGACTYYEYAIEADPKEMNYYRDAAIAAAKAGEIKKAENFLSKVRTLGAEDTDLCLIQANVAAQSEDWETVIQNAGRVREESHSVEIGARADLLLAKAYDETGNQQERIAVLTDAVRLTGDYATIRILGNEFLKMAYAATGNEQSAFVTQAEECYKKLDGVITLGYQDQLNQAIVWEMQGNYEKSLKKLQSLTENAAADYQLYVYLAYVGYMVQNQKAVEIRSYTQVMGYFSKAQSLYQQAGSPQDPQMEKIADIISGIITGSTDAKEETADER
ncbi:MAG: protein kinase [Lachnospiraceae bacterium]|nr:protein kinase [Lachnospiraceae bacterium]